MRNAVRNRSMLGTRTWGQSTAAVPTYSFYFAVASTWKLPNVLPSGSTKYPCQQVLGTANFGRATIPAASVIVFAVASKSSTSSEQTNAFVPDCGGGVLAGRFSRPPREPPVSMVQYGIGRPGTSENFHPKTR